MYSQFYEKPYETAFNIELGKTVISTSQLAEKTLGYDAYANPRSNHRIWRILGAKPIGVVLTEKHWLNAGLVRPMLDPFPYSTSLLLQYKRPEYLNSRRSKQWRLWQRPYYRFKITPHQQNILHSLEQILRGRVLVRYAAPCFHTWVDFISHIKNGSFIDHSGFVAPSKLQTHDWWTYTSPGTTGKPNRYEKGDEFIVEDQRYLFAQLRELGTSSLKSNLVNIALTLRQFLSEDSLAHTSKIIASHMEGSEISTTESARRSDFYGDAEAIMGARHSFERFALKYRTLIKGIDDGDIQESPLKDDESRTILEGLTGISLLSHEFNLDWKVLLTERETA